MTGKRFTLKYPHWTHVLCDTVENEEYYLRLLEKREDVVNLLNQLSDENEQLQKDCTALIYHNQEYRKKNEQLKKENIKLKEDLEWQKSIIGFKVMWND